MVGFNLTLVRTKCHRSVLDAIRLMLEAVAAPAAPMSNIKRIFSVILRAIPAQNDRTEYLTAPLMFSVAPTKPVASDKACPAASILRVVAESE